jgi:hypothetical protein
MFSALRRLAQHQMPACPQCQQPMQLHLTYAFALGVTKRDALALAAFLPADPPKWDDQGRVVTFYPFLVVVERAPSERAAWLPYFHVVRDPTTQKVVSKYGQWAPFLGLALFEDLLVQARKAGYLLGAVGA